MRSSTRNKNEVKVGTVLTKPRTLTNITRGPNKKIHQTMQPSSASRPMKHPNLSASTTTSRSRPPSFKRTYGFWQVLFYDSVRLMKSSTPIYLMLFNAITHKPVLVVTKFIKFSKSALIIKHHLK